MLDQCNLYFNTMIFVSAAYVAEPSDSLTSSGTIGQINLLIASVVSTMAAVVVSVGIAMTVGRIRRYRASKSEAAAASTTMDCMDKADVAEDTLSRASSITSLS